MAFDRPSLLIDMAGRSPLDCYLLGLACGALQELCYNEKMQRINYRVRKTTLSDHGSADDVASLMPEERLAMVSEITKDTWAFMGQPVDDTPMQRHVVRILRRGQRT